MSLNFNKEDVEPATYPDEEHPLELFVHGDGGTRREVFLNHLDTIVSFSLTTMSS